MQCDDNYNINISLVLSIPFIFITIKTHQTNLPSAFNVSAGWFGVRWAINWWLSWLDRNWKFLCDKHKHYLCLSFSIMRYCLELGILLLLFHKELIWVDSNPVSLISIPFLLCSCVPKFYSTCKFYLGVFYKHFNSFHYNTSSESLLTNFVISS